MKLDELASGESVYIDTNVLYMYLRSDPAYLPVIRQFLERVVHGELDAYVSLLVLDELLYRLLLAQIKDATGQNPLDVLRWDTPKAVSTYSPQVDAPVRKLMNLPHITLVGSTADDFGQMLDNIITFSLLPRDALHLAITQRLKITNIASDDTDFERITGLTRYWVINQPGN